MKVIKQILSLGLTSLVLSVFLQIFTIPAHAQENVKKDREAKKEKVGNIFKAHDLKHDSLKNEAKSIPESQDINDEMPHTGIPAFDSLMQQSYVDHYIFNVQHEKKTFTQQYYSGIFIFIMVVVIVSMGLVLSFKQFKLNEEIIRHSMKQNNGTIDKGTDTASSMEVSKDGIKMNTAVIGLMILVISLVFFFLYLKFVYHIEVIK